MTFVFNDEIKNFDLIQLFVFVFPFFAKKNKQTYNLARFSI